MVEERNQARAIKAQALADLKEKKIAAKKEALLLKEAAAAKLAEEKAIAAAERQKRREEIAQERYASRRNPNSAAIWASFAPPPRPKLQEVQSKPTPVPVINPVKVEKLSKKRPYLEFTAKQNKELEQAFKDVRFKFEDRLSQNAVELEALIEELKDPNVRKDKMNDGYPVDDEMNKLIAVNQEIPVKLMWLDQAEIKFKKKKFGRCEFCYEDIIFDRLVLYPEISSCKNCLRKL